jgi:hypothetical protein
MTVKKPSGWTECERELAAEENFETMEVHFCLNDALVSTHRPLPPLRWKVNRGKKIQSCTRS